MQIERSFRIIKSELSVRPVFHWTVSRMKAHFAICYISFALLRFVQFKLDAKQVHLSTEQIHAALDDVKMVYITSKGDVFRLAQDITEQSLTVYKVLRIAAPKKFSVS